MSVHAPIVSVGPLAPHRGGISHYHTLLCRALDETGPTQAVSFTRLYPDRLFPGKTQLDESGAEIGFPSKRIIDSVDPRSWVRAGRHARAFVPERIVFQWWHPFFLPAYATLAAVARRATPRPRVVFVCHNVRPHEGTVVDEAVLRAAFRVPDAFVVHAESEGQALRTLAPGRAIAVHPHPPYDVFSTTTKPPSRGEARATLGLDGDVLLFFGLVRAYKGLATLLDALPLVGRERPLTLVVAGEFYDDRAPYLAQIRAHGLEDRVRVVDRYIANEDVATYFTAADVVVQPYVHATQSGISQIAFAFGVPVIATAVGGLPESIDDGETGLLVPPEDPAALARAIARFFDDELGAPMRRAIRAQEMPTWRGLADVVAHV